VYNKKFKEWIKDNKHLKATVQSLYNIVMQNKLMTVTIFEKMETNGDATNLLKEIRRISLQIEMSTSIYNKLSEDNVILYTYIQGEEEINAKHLRNFKSITEAVEHLGGTIFADDALIGVEMKEDDTKGRHIKSDNKYKQIFREKMM